MTFPGYLTLVAAFVIASFGCGLPLARRWLDDPLERLCAAPVIGLTIAFVTNFVGYINGVRMEWFALLPLVGAIGLACERRTLFAFWRDRDTRNAGLGWLVIAAWTQFLAMTIVSYSGGSWAVDWMEHHQRAVFFREHVDLRFLFVGDYLLPARPPLVNVVVAGYQAISEREFACDQVVMALWSSLVFLPAALFCRRTGAGRNSIAILVVLFALNPAFLQNSTFAWTKLPTAFFVLTGAHFLFRSLESPTRPVYFALAALALTSGLLAHYSAGPLCAVLVLWWLAWRIRKRGLAVLRQECFMGVAVVVPLLGLWLGWSVVAYGAADTFLSNSTVLTAGPASASTQVTKILLNLRDTLVPHVFRDVDHNLIRQASQVSWWRDYFFMIVQVNLFGLLGSGGALALGYAIWRDRGAPANHDSPLQARWLWPGVIAGIVVGTAVHGAADEWGLAHICLQPLGVLGVAALAAKSNDLGRIGLGVLIAGLAWDASVNIGLHYWLQAQPPLPEWLGNRDLVDVYHHHGFAAFNAGLKDVTRVRFLRDTLAVYGLVAPLVVMVGATCVWRRSERAPTHFLSLS